MCVYINFVHRDDYTSALAFALFLYQCFFQYISFFSFGL